MTINKQVGGGPDDRKCHGENKIEKLSVDKDSSLLDKESQRRPI